MAFWNDELTNEPKGTNPRQLKAILFAASLFIFTARRTELTPILATFAHSTCQDNLQLSLNTFKNEIIQQSQQRRAETTYARK